MRTLLTCALLLLATACTHTPSSERASTARAGVSVLPNRFTIPGLERPRTVRLYLPPSYAQGMRRYPVIYMHDAQNLFDEATAPFGEWGVDETLDAIAAQQGFEAIVVGVDHGNAHRTTELNPWDHPRFGRGEGVAYAAFVAEVLRPWVDEHYRTLTGPEHTAIIGSSLGALLSDYAIHRYPAVFGRAAMLSPAYWVADPAVYAYAEQHPLPAGARVWFSVGSHEGDSTVPDAERMHRIMAAQRPEPGAVSYHLVPGGKHHEPAWRAELPRALAFLFAPAIAP